MTKHDEAQERHDSDDFGGVGCVGAALVIAVVFLTHPVQGLKELLPLMRRLGRRAVEFVLAPFGAVVLVLWSRHRDRRPTFEDYLRRSDTDDGHG